MKAKAVRVKEYNIVGGLDLEHGEYVIRVFFNAALIDCFKGRTEQEATAAFERAGFRMFQIVAKEPSEQKQEKAEDGRSAANDSGRSAPGS